MVGGEDVDVIKELRHNVAGKTVLYVHLGMYLVTDHFFGLIIRHRFGSVYIRVLKAPFIER